MIRDRVDGKENIGIQAARFSLYVPLAVFLIGFCLNTRSQTDAARGDAGVSVALGWLNVVLIILGFVLGIFALASMKRFGKKGILGRAIGGVLLNGFFVAMMVTIFGPLLARRQMAAKMPGQLVGAWHMTSSPKMTAGATMDIALAADKTFDFHMISPGVDMHILGTYQFTTGDRALGIKVERVENGDPKVVGQTILLGRVAELDAKHMRLETKDGDELYDRK